MPFINKIFSILNLLYLTFACCCLSVLLYIRQMWPNASYEQILITLNDLSLDMIISNVSSADYFGAFLFFAVIYPLCYFFLNFKQRFFAALVFSISFLWLSGFLSYRIYRNMTSTLFEEEYVNPHQISYVFPQKKRNLILIYLESFEQNFTQAEYYERNLLPNLTKLQNQGNYSPAHYELSGTNFSIAALVSSQCGIPLRYLPDRDIYATRYFLPQAVCLTEILKENGYQTTLIKGADITFTDTHIFAKSHGYDEALGVNEILQQYPEEQHDSLMGTFGGVNDETLFSYAKKRLEKFSPNKPFMLTLFSLDTHLPSTYRNPSCEETFGDTRDIFMCTDRTVYQFIDWLKHSPYWDNTTVVILGDHLLPLKLKAKGRPRRSIFNVFLNVPQGLKLNSKKNFTTYDIAPSILEGMGINLSPRAFGLGRSLFSEEPTLLEKIGFEKLKLHLLQNSEMYHQFTQPTQQRIETFAPYQMGLTITNADLPDYADIFEEFLGIYYIDRLNLDISENITSPIHVTLLFNAILNYNSKVIITVNDRDIFTFTPDANHKSPYMVSFDIPADIIATGRIQLKFRNTSGVGSAAQIGIAPLEIRLTTE